MRILWATIDKSLRVARHLYEGLPNEVARLVHVTFLTRHTGNMLFGPYQRCVLNGSIRQEEMILPYLQKNKEHFDFLMIDSLLGFDTEQWHNIDIPMGVYVEDLHKSWTEVEKAIEYDAEVIFHKYKLPMTRFYPDAVSQARRLVWLPHAINTGMFRPGPFRLIEVLHTGRIHKHEWVYPERTYAWRWLRGKDYFTRVERPDETPYSIEKWPTGEVYSDLLGSAKISIVCGSIYHYAVLKFFEIAACGTVLMSDWFEELGMLGFRPGENMVVMDLSSSDRLDDQMRWFLTHAEERCRIAENGMELVHKYHSIGVRAKQLINHICKIIGKPKMFEIEYDFCQEFSDE
jgi:hypothetical protein